MADIDKWEWRKGLEAIERIEASQSSAETFEETRRYYRSLGADTLLIGQVANPILAGRSIRHFGLSDWHEDYQNEWVTNDNVAHDPITQYALKTRRTFDWKTARAHGSPRGQAILDRGRDFGMENGIAIPVTSGSLPLGVLSIGLPEQPPRELLGVMEVVAIHAYSHLLTFLDSLDSAMPIQLTPRELDVLTFSAAGKTCWEISRIYSISEATVRTHMRNIIRKLNAANKTHAVTLALRSGQIMP